MSNIISIITVVYKDFEGLKKTIHNVLNLELNEFEHIIIDGGSGIKTETFLKKYNSIYRKKKINFKWISEPDQGIYDAMNKGIALANGEWLNFMNAGDIFGSKTVLNKITPYLKNNKVLIYGNKKQDNKIINPLPLKYLQIGLIMACHQSMFFNKKYLGKELFYNKQYNIYADYELVNRIFNKYPSKIEYVDTEISIFQGGGVSESVSYQKRKDKLKIVFKTYGLIGVFKTYMFKYFPNYINL